MTAVGPQVVDVHKDFVVQNFPMPPFFNELLSGFEVVRKTLSF